MSEKLTDVELTGEVAKLLGWKNIRPFEGVLRGEIGQIDGYIPPFAMSIDACEAILWHRQVYDWWIGKESVRLWDSACRVFEYKYNPEHLIANGTIPNVARAICEAFRELCEKEKGK